MTGGRKWGSFQVYNHNVDLELDALPDAVHHHAPAANRRRRLARFPEFKNRQPKLGWHWLRLELDEQEEYCVLLASCDGLLLLRKNVGDYVVCNPATRRWAKLPPMRIGRDLRHMCESGFYFHSPSGEYRLLCHYTKGPYTNTTARYYVLSVGGGSPRRLAVQATPIPNPAIPNGTPSDVGKYTKLITPAALHGRQHWLQHPEAGLTDQMVAFDTVAETFRRMTPPPVTRTTFADLLATDGSLMASEFTDTSVDLWVLEGYGAMDGREVAAAARRVMPWQAHVILVTTGGGFGVYNVRSKTARGVVDVKRPGVPWFVHRESLVQHAFFNDQSRNCLPLFRFHS
ncbi:hypothetical protein E2562_020488 [Oryza meyeriana var. granulata]|uniref:F-box associated domain-containing protein n=1 Tax=Oryza meyeriana var. granulata TaxID=110450 RepID=A0A6G1D5T6_9ORYZ|nr:hypothetical protein E2562_020488 [Oryza meyeriana var. granulata]